MKLVIEVFAEPDEPLGVTFNRAGKMVNAFVSNIDQSKTTQWYVDAGKDQPNIEHYALLTEAITGPMPPLNEGAEIPANEYRTKEVGGRIVLMKQEFSRTSLLAEVQGTLVGVNL